MNTRRLKSGYNYLKKNGIIKSINKLHMKHLNKKQMKNVSQNYDDYISNNEPTVKELEKQKNEHFEIEPLISIVIPMYNTPEKFFDELLDSILNQTYSNWQLCLADGSGNTANYISKRIKEINDDRIVYKLLDEVGLLRKDFDGAQDYDFVLRATGKAKKISHISKILYHWRAHQNSTAGATNSKAYVFEAGKRAIEYNLKENNLDGKVSILEDEPGRYRVDYTVKGNPKVSIIIPNKDAKSDLKKCIESVLESTYKNIEIIIVENNSVKSETFNYYEKIQNENKNVSVKKIEIDEFNYSKINNYGEKFATGEYIILLNNDTSVITKDWIEKMLGVCQRNDVGIVGAKLLYPDKTTQHVGVVIGIGGIAGHVNTNLKENDPGYFSRATVINDFSAVTAACLMVKKELYEAVGGLTEEFKVAFNDIDFCLKIRQKGYLVVLNPFAKLTHYESKTRGMEDTKEKIQRFESEIDLFKEKWKRILEFGDPYFNINFRLDKSNFYINTNKIVRRQK